MYKLYSIWQKYNEYVEDKRWGRIIFYKSNDNNTQTRGINTDTPIHTDKIIHYKERKRRMEQDSKGE